LSSSAERQQGDDESVKDEFELLRHTVLLLLLLLSMFIGLFLVLF
jgi:hypothetical protein